MEDKKKWIKFWKEKWSFEIGETVILIIRSFKTSHLYWKMANNWSNIQLEIAETGQRSDTNLNSKITNQNPSKISH